jgi:5-formyltetrahydrofolate cyclo-ligase
MDLPSKAFHRKQARRILATLAPELRPAASGEICRRIAAMRQWAGARTVGLYAAQASEPDLSGLLDLPGKTFCFPRVIGEGMEFRQCQSMELLLEPDPGRCPMVSPSEIDLLLIPGLAFTRSGGRLGRGGGFYDRFLIGTHPCAIKMGVCFHVQLAEALPLEAHDHEVDWVVTEREVVRAG